MITDAYPPLHIGSGRTGVSLLTRRYPRRMSPSADHVAAALRDQIPEVQGDKLHRLLYYTQGHHLALYGQPAFDTPILAGPDGPTIDGLGEPQPYKPGSVGDSIHAVCTVVAARYGGLTTDDLDRLTRTEPPWRETVPDQAINHGQLRRFFTDAGRQDNTDHHTPDYVAAAHREVIAAHRNAPAQPDDLPAILAKVARDDR